MERTKEQRRRTCKYLISSVDDIKCFVEAYIFEDIYEDTEQAGKIIDQVGNLLEQACNMLDKIEYKD